MKTKLLTFLLALTFLFNTTAITEVSGETKKVNIATGTGFFLGSSNYVVTNYHVIHGAKKIQVKLINGEILVAEVALKSPDKDIAILKLNGTPSVKRMNVRLSNFSEIRTGDKVFTYGFPIAVILGDVSSIYSEGVINSLKGMRNKQDEFQMSIPIQPGNSGGPIFNTQGELVGITSSTLSPLGSMEALGIVPQNVNFGIKSSVLANLLSEIPEILKFDMGIVVVPSEPFTLRDFKEDIKKNIVFVTGLIEKEVGNFQVAEQAKEKGDYKIEIEQWKILAEQGIAGAQYNLGQMYLRGQGVPQDYKEAVKWYRLAAEQGNANAQFNLAQMYANGDGVTQDYKEAIKWWKLAAEQGDAKAQFNLGVMYEKGETVPQDYKEVIKWYRLAAEQGFAEAQDNLAQMYRQGDGVTQDYKEALKLWKLAAEQGIAGAQYNLAQMYQNGDGVTQDYKEAIKWWKLAAEQGIAGAQYNLGVMYDNGQGVPQDYKEALKWYRLAAEQGVAEAQDQLGQIYLTGVKGILQDYKEAFKWNRLAAEQENTTAQYNLGWMYNRGHGVPQDLKEAEKWYRLSAEQGYGIAQNNLGVIYEYGDVFLQDYTLAHMWYNLAGSNDYEKGVKNRNKIEKKMTPQQIEKAQEMARNWKPKK
ncbi:trypsin-like peptidase domain-containing protein [Nitrospinaceae bacterium]|nr:trypsin-like peptidase domain-containing protein [Nitrospinaceae bacterium]